MPLTRRAALASTLAFPFAARAQSAPGPKLKIGLLTDLSSTYRDLTGPVAVACARQAVAEFTAANPSFQVEVVVADYQQKADIGATIAREWFDRENVDVIEGLGNSAVSAAVTTVAQERDKVVLNTAAGSSDLTGKLCSPNFIHWTYDSWCLGQANAAATVSAGGKSWFFVTPDYSYGHATADDTGRAVVAAGGTVLGTVAYPFPTTTDFSAFLLQAQASGAQVFGLGAAGADLVNCVKQMREFGMVSKGTTIVGLGGSITDIMAMGLDVAEGMRLSEPFYWDLNDRTRAFMTRLKPTLPAGKFPGQDQAGSYAAITHYLKTAKSMGFAEAKKSGRTTVAAMKAIPTDDDCFGKGNIRDDGRTIHAVYSFRAKAPAESKYPGDVMELVGTLAGEKAFRPLALGGCPMIKS